MADIILNTDELVVLGGPANITVDTSIGAQGPRGSRIFAGNGNPNDPSTVIGQTPALFDLYINLLVSDEEYLYLYQYIIVDSSATWVPLFKLIPNTYSDNNLVEFTAGSGTALIPLASIVPESLIASVTPDSFNIIATPSSTSPIALSVSIAEEFTTVNEALNLEITLYGAEFSGSSWSDLEGTLLVYLYVTLGQESDLIS